MQLYFVYIICLLNITFDLLSCVCRDSERNKEIGFLEAQIYEYVEILGVKKSACFCFSSFMCVCVCACTYVFLYIYISVMYISVLLW